MDEFPFDEPNPADYECLNCGTIVSAHSHPGECEECGGGVQNRAVPLE